MIGVILAAGMAKRLRPLTDNCPKCLLTVGSRTLLQRIVEAMTGCGITELAVVTGYRHEMIRDFLTANYPELTIHFINNDDYATTNNIYSLWLAKPYADGRDFILTDSDILLDPLLIKTMAGQEVAALAVNRHELGEEEMKVVVDDNGRITEISKTCSPEAAIGESVGVEKMTAEYATALYRELDKMITDEGLSDVFYERAFERLMPQGHIFRMVDTTDIFSMELDTVEDFHCAQQKLPRHLL